MELGLAPGVLLPSRDLHPTTSARHNHRRRAGAGFVAYKRGTCGPGEGGGNSLRCWPEPVSREPSTTYRTERQPFLVWDEILGLGLVTTRDYRRRME